MYWFGFLLFCFCSLFCPIEISITQNNDCVYSVLECGQAKQIFLCAMLFTNLWFRTHTCWTLLSIFQTIGARAFLLWKPDLMSLLLCFTPSALYCYYGCSANLTGAPCDTEKFMYRKQLWNTDLPFIQIFVLKFNEIQINWFKIRIFLALNLVEISIYKMLFW